MTDHERFGALAGAYALGTLSPEDRRTFETHLASCAECRRNLRDAAVAGEGLGRAVEQRDPLRDSGPAPRAGGSAGVPAWMLAAAALAAVALGLYAWTLNNRLKATEAELRTAQSRLTTFETQMTDLRRATSETSQAEEVITAADTVRIDLAGQPAAPQATGRAFWSPSRGVVLTASNLPELPAGRVYQLWLVTDARKISAGLLRPDGAGHMRGVARTPSAIEPKAFAVTIEPDGGVPAPTGAMYLLGST